MMVQVTVFLVALLATMSKVSLALTDSEIAAFRAATNIIFPYRNAFARVTRNEDDTLTVESSGVPDHETYQGGSGRPWYINQPGDCKMVASKFTHKVIVPNTPTVATVPGCVPEYAGVALNGVAIYFGLFDSRNVKQYIDPLFGNGSNPPNECLDQCGAHPNPRGMYHYHGFSSLTNSAEGKPCWFPDAPNVPSSIVGVAFDGYAIYGPYDEDGTELVSADLDECHGKVDSDGMYRYRVTRDFPYILGCMKGQVIDDQVLPTIAYGNEVDTCSPGFGNSLEVYTACCKYSRAKIETNIPGYEINELSQVLYGTCSAADVKSSCRCVDNNKALQDFLSTAPQITCRNYYMCLVDDDCPGNTVVSHDAFIESGSQFQTCVKLGTSYQSERICVQTKCLDGTMPTCSSSSSSTPTNPTSVLVVPVSTDYNDWVQPMRCSDGSAATCPSSLEDATPTSSPTFVVLTQVPIVAIPAEPSTNAPIGSINAVFTAAPVVNTSRPILPVTLTPTTAAPDKSSVSMLVSHSILYASLLVLTNALIFV
jgi:hypothetical protein